MTGADHRDTATVNACTAQVNLTQVWSAVPFQSFAGGEYKSSSTASFPGSTSMSAALFRLKPGGVREPHWHAVDECVAWLLDVP